MEILPILSTIILVGTIATFVLAICAYWLYKSREGSNAGQTTAQREATGAYEPHMLEAPAMPYATAPAQLPAWNEAHVQPAAPAQNGMFWEYNSYGQQAAHQQQAMHQQQQPVQQQQAMHQQYAQPMPQQAAPEHVHTAYAPQQPEMHRQPMQAQRPEQGGFAWL